MNKEEKILAYETLLPQLASLMADERDEICRMANFCALLHEEMKFFWTGFYRVIDGELRLGPFQGPIACTRIAKGRGVCGTCWQQGRTIIVPDVEQFPGHIACSSLSRSEIVVPIKDYNNDVIAVLDIDSKALNTFDAIDQEYLEKAVLLLQ